MTMDVRPEFYGARLGDWRRTSRLVSIVEQLQKCPGKSFPKAMASDAALEGVYRFMNNDQVQPKAVLAPHRKRSWGRSDASGAAALVLHDTTVVSLPGDTQRRGVPIDGDKQSFSLHVAIAAAEGPAPVVHGVVGMDAYTVWDGRWYRESSLERQELWVGSQRWAELVLDVREEAPTGLPLIHVMDREADDYALWSYIVQCGDDFVIRAQHNRKVRVDGRRVSEELVLADVLDEREVTLSRRPAGQRPPKSKKTHPNRESRMARLSLRSARVEVVRPSGVEPLGTPSMELWVVDVCEEEPPEGETPVRWRLMTTLPARTPAEAWRIVDIYRKRWLIEEFFKALKTGCQLEARQAESLPALLNVVAVLLPLAWQLLVLRAVERDAPDSPGEDVVTPTEMLVLRQQVPKRMLPARPTARQVVRAIAKLGGHIDRNGPPGWLVIGRGLEHLHALVAGWLAAMRWNEMTSRKEYSVGGIQEM